MYVHMCIYEGLAEIYDVRMLGLGWGEHSTQVKPRGGWSLSLH